MDELYTNTIEKKLFLFFSLLFPYLITNILEMN